MAELQTTPTIEAVNQTASTPAIAAPSPVPAPAQVTAQPAPARSTAPVEVPAPTRTSGRARIPSKRASEAAYVPEKVRASVAGSPPGLSGEAKAAGRGRPSKATTKRSTDSSASSQTSAHSPSQPTAALPSHSFLPSYSATARSSQGSDSSPKLGTDRQEQQSKARWTEREDVRLTQLVRIRPSLSWGEISGRMGTGPGGTGVTRPAQGCAMRW